jgi:hypothetical protein
MVHSQLLALLNYLRFGGHRNSLEHKLSAKPPSSIQICATNFLSKVVQQGEASRRHNVVLCGRNDYVIRRAYRRAQPVVGVPGLGCLFRITPL